MCESANSKYITHHFLWRWLKTELSARKQAVLAAVVKAYIETGEPIGSRILTGLLENAPSSATLRNEMNELCMLGFLEQPHTSAGRVPTSLGYRLYINSLMGPAHLDDATKAYIDANLKADVADPRALPKRAAEVLKNLTGFPAISCYLEDSRAYLKSAQLLPAGKRAAVLLIITSDGRTLSRVCSVPSGYSERLSAEFSRIVDTRLKLLSLNEFTVANLQSIVASACIGAFELTPTIALLFKMVAEITHESLNISGTTELYNVCGEEGARRVLALAQNGEPFISLICGGKNTTDVIFGNDTGIPELSRRALVVSKYYSGNRYCGRIGIIGTGRMSYDLILPSIEYTASRLTQLITEAAKDLED